MTQELTDGNFAEEVLQADRLVLVDFWAAWCGPCKMIGPIVERLSSELSSSVKIGKLNVDHNPTTAQEYGVSSIPTLLLFRGGKVIGTTTGFTSEPNLREFIASHGGIAVK